MKLFRSAPRADRVAAAAIIVLSAIETAVGAHPWGWLITPLAGVAIAAATLTRRRDPEWFVPIWGAGVVLAVVGHWTPIAHHGVAGVAAAMGLYSLARYGRWPLSIIAILAIGLAMAAVASWNGSGEGGIIGNFVAVAVLVALGYQLREADDRRARQLESTLFDERQRIARDLHDLIAHNLSAILVQADAATLVAAEQPAVAARALDRIRETARSSLAEMRQVIGILRTGDVTGPDQAPDLTTLSDLVSTDAAGPRVEVELPPSLDRVPLTISRSLFRIAQESITNARRHAVDATVIRVSISTDDDSVRLVVHDDGKATTPPSGLGFGLQGMRERIGLLDGEISAGFDPYGGWKVTASAPLSWESR